MKTNPLIYEPYDIKYCPLSSDDNVYTCLLNIVEDGADLIEDTIKDGGKLIYSDFFPTVSYTIQVLYKVRAINESKTQAKIGAIYLSFRV